MIIKRRMYGSLYFSLGFGLVFLALGFSFAADVQQPVQQVSETSFPTQALKVSVDFVETPVSDVAYFVTQQTGIGFTFSLKEPVTVNWSQFNVDKEELIEGFNAVLATVGLGCYPVDAGGRLYIVEKIRKVSSLVRVSSITRMSTGDVYLMYDDKVYRKSEFPYKLQLISGRSWYASVPSN